MQALVLIDAPIIDARQQVRVEIVILKGDFGHN
jgi:hypothetical protein